MIPPTRIAAALFVFLHVAFFRSLAGHPEPAHARPVGYAVAGLMLVVSLAQASGGVRRSAARRYLALDVAAVTTLLLLFRFDPRGFLFVLTVLVVVEGALVGETRGALASWAVVSTGYALREIVGPQGSAGPELVLLRVLVTMMLAALVGSLVTTTRRLRRLNEMKAVFLSALPHELRAPLTAVLGFADTLLARGHRLTPDERAEMLRSIASGARRLERLVDDLLDIDRVERKDLRIDRSLVDLEALASRAASEAPLGARRLVLDVAPAGVSVDRVMVERILANLLSNAAKHTPGSATIRLSAHADDRALWLEVEDDGPGVPDEFKEEIFAPFKRMPSRARRSSGTGIGLYLIAEFARLHGGRAWVEDGSRGGARFRVALPLPVSTGPDLSPSPRAEAS